jgi:hypothetical protein
MRNVIDLSLGMTQRVREWYRLGNKLDVRLLNECSYYPRGGCQDCSWEAPNPDCKWSHILIDTRCDNRGNAGRIHLKVVKRKENWLAALIAKLPKEAREEIEKVMKG